MAEEETPSTSEPAEQQPEPANRAERRAKGKGKSAQSQHAHGKGPIAGTHGPAQARRNYGTRRTGG